MRHERQTLIAGWDQKRIAKASATLVGAGAIGSALATVLARIGFREIRIIDFDVLEEHNLENQIYTQQDVGKHKALALAEHLDRIDPSVRVMPVVARLEDYTGPLQTDFVFGCLDSVASRIALNWVAAGQHLTYVDGGIAGLGGQVQTYVPGKTACLQCWPVLPKETNRPGCSSDPIPSTYATAAVCANLMALQAVKMLFAKPCRSYFSFDLEKGDIVNGDLEPSPDCDACGGAQ